MAQNKPRFIDCHAHVNFAAYDSDRDEVVKRALQNHTWIVNVGTQKDTSKKAVEMAEQYGEGVYAIVGTHPIHTDKSFHDEKELGNDAKEFTSRGEIFDYAYYKKLAEHPKVVAIGECGLDFYRLEAKSEEKQREAFVRQIHLANEIEKPLMLHVRSGSGRSAYREALAVLKSEAKVGGNFHFFAGSVEELKDILDAGFYVSFTGVITFTSDYDELVRYAPLERILSETDCPYVTPAPHRGKRNEPLYVQEVVERIASLKRQSTEETAHVLWQNALEFFDI